MEWYRYHNTMYNSDNVLSMKNIFCAAVGLENVITSLHDIVVLPAVNPAVSVMLKNVD